MIGYKAEIYKNKQKKRAQLPSFDRSKSKQWITAGMLVAVAPFVLFNFCFVCMMLATDEQLKKRGMV